MIRRLLVVGSVALLACTIWFAALLTVSGLGSILATLPLTPGGLGLVEGVMVPAFVAFGVPATTALLGVIGWRLLEFWLPLPVAVLAYSSLRLGPIRSDPPAAAKAPGPRREMTFGPGPAGRGR